MKIDPQDADFYYNQGNAKSKLGDKQGAIGDFTKASELFRQQGNIKNYQQTIQMIKKIKER